MVLDGVAYQQGADGSSRTVEGAEKTPFMTMTFLEKDSGNLFDIPSNAEKPMVRLSVLAPQGTSSAYV